MRFAIIVGTCIASIGIAAAQPDTDGDGDAVDAPPQRDEPPAVKLFMEGRALLEAGKAAEACAKFEESLKLDQTAAGTMLNLGLCNEASGKRATAIRWFRRAQTSAAEQKQTGVEDAAKQKTAALLPTLATLEVVVSAPAGWTVTLDGDRLDELELVRVEIDAGRHVIELSADNAPTVRKEIDAVDGKALTVVLETKPYPPKEKQYEIVDLGERARRRSMIYGGVGLGLVAASGVLGGVGRILHDGGELPGDFRRWKHVVRYGGTSLFLAGAAAISYGVILRVRARGKVRREVVSLPVIAPGHVGFAVAKAF